MMVRFTTKKIESLTLGERLKKMRNERRLGVNDISKATRIQMRYLQYLEDGEYAKLPADVYVKGFLRSYAQYMGISEKALIKQYEREKGIQKSIGIVPEVEKKKERLNFSNWTITPRILVIGAVFLILGGSFFYLYNEVNNFVSVPRLVILEPRDGASIGSAATTIKGVAEKGAVISINDQSVMVNDKGEFGEEIGLQKGVNTIIVKAKNRFDKESAQTIVVNAEYELPESPQPNDVPLDVVVAESSENVSVEITTNPEPTWLSVSSDGNVVYSGVLEPGEAKIFKANESVVITSAKGNHTFVRVNGKDTGALGGPGSVTDVVFTKNGRK